MPTSQFKDLNNLMLHISCRTTDFDLTQDPRLFPKYIK